MMRALISLLFIFLLSFIIIGCKMKVDELKVPITTSSKEAENEFLEGRSLADKLLLTNSIQHFDKAIALDSGFAIAYLNRANTSFTAKDFFFYLNQAIALKDRCSEGERFLILSAEAAANANTAKQKEYLDKIITLYPGDERVHFNLGGYYFGQQDYTKAIEQYKKAIEIAPGFSPAYNILGYAYRQTENYSEAENAFKKYIELIPNDPNPYDSYAELLLKMGRFDESIINYQKALDIDRNFTASHIGIATNYMYKGEIDSGSARLKTLYELARNDGERRQALFTQIVIYVDAGKIDTALQELEKQYALSENSKDAAQMAADNQLRGAILFENGKYDDALKAYEKSAQIIASSGLSQELKDNAQLQLHYNRASVAIGKTDLKKAKIETETFIKNLDTNSNLNQIWLGHELTGKIALAEKKYDLAIEELLQANQQNPYNLYRLALCYRVKGDKEEAKEFCRKAAEFNGLPAINYAFIRAKAEKLLATLYTL